MKHIDALHVAAFRVYELLDAAEEPSGIHLCRVQGIGGTGDAAEDEETAVKLEPLEDLGTGEESSLSSEAAEESAS